MPGQGYHLGVSKKICEMTGERLSEELIIGTLIVDALNAAAGSRRASHFTGGAGCIIPYYTELRQCSKIQSWDSGYRKSYLVDPKIEMKLFEASNRHLPEGAYKDGIRFHLISDRSYDQLVQTRIFDVSSQKDGIIKVRATGRELSGAEFRSELYKSYPMLDSYMLNLAGITSEDVEKAKELVRSTMNEAHAEFICKYLNYPEVDWEDTEFFNKDVIATMVADTLSTALDYFL